MAQIKIDIITETVHSHSLKLTSDTIIHLLQKAGHNIPTNARVEFKVPSGGDYSGLTLSFDTDEDLFLNVNYQTFEGSV